MKKIFSKFIRKEDINNSAKLNRLDLIIIAILVIVYGILSFYRLGSFRIPETYYNFGLAGNSVELKLTSESSISKIRYYTGYNFGDFRIMTSLDGKEYEYLTDFSTHSVFTWNDFNIDTDAKYIKFVSKSDNECLGDIQFYDNNGNKIMALRVNENGRELTDELYMVPDDISYLNSSYFDEIYFVRSAYEYVHGISNYEWTHPPLGKLLMALPILVFGFKPFTFRLMGNIAGILMIPVIYILTMKIFKDRKWAILGAILMAFDNFHFAQTRMGTVDGILVLFILLSVLFMKNYLDLDKKNNMVKVSKNLLLSGLFIGCAIATKWNAIYVALGLAIVFFIDLYKQYQDKIKNIFTNEHFLKELFLVLSLIIIIPLVIYYLSMIIVGKSVADGYILSYFITLLIMSVIFFYKKNSNDKYLIRLSLICVISFIIIPVLIYIMSYLLFPNVDYYDGTLHGIISQIKLMYNYHANLEATHPFSSEWYQWPIMYKPVWYYAGATNINHSSTIVGIGNPAIWWFGIVSFGYVLIDAIKNHNKESIFILIFILSAFVPYIFVKRIMFMYHYFIVLPFVMLAIVAFVKGITEKMKNNYFYIFYIVLVVILFIIFYPLVSGIPVSDEYINSLKWLSSWIF